MKRTRSRGLRDVDFSQALLHYAVRVRLYPVITGKRYSVIAEHNSAVRKYGSTFFAKFGAPATEQTAEALKAQISKGTKPRLYVIARRGAGYIAFSAPIVSVHRGAPTAAVKERLPEYYSQLDSTAYFWLEIGAEFLNDEIATLRLASNHRPLQDVLRESRTAAMIVEQVSPAQVEPVGPVTPPSSTARLT